MLTLFILALAAAIVAFVIYPTYFGDVSGDHVNGINAMIFVQEAEDAAVRKTEARKAAIERAFSPA